jgi:hypothetical protein
MTKHAIRKPKAYKGERTWPEILEATGPLINFLESVSNQVAAKWRGGHLETEFGPLAARVAVVEAWAVNDLDGLPDVRPREHQGDACPLWIAERDGVRGDENIQ